MNTRVLALLASIAALMGLAACGGGGMTTVKQSFTVSATVTGLSSGTLVLQNDAGQQLTFTSNTTQAFSNQYASGASYSVTVATQPSGLTCNLASNASGTISGNVTVQITCTSNPVPLTLSATVTGLSGTLVLQDDIGHQLTFTSNSTQTFDNTYSSGDSYSVIVATQPSAQTCTLGSNASGTITANVTVQVTCASNATLTLGAAVTGVAGTLVLQDDVGNQLTFTADGTQTFGNTYASGSTYAVTILTPPAGQICTLGSNATGTITANTTVQVTCTSSAVLTLSATVTGLSGTLVLQDDSGAQLTFTSNTTQTFANAYASGATYAVSIVTQPATQTCTLSSNATGIITVNTTVTVTCTTALFNINVNVTGLSGTGLVFQDNGADNLPAPTNGLFTFATQIASGSTYAVTVLTQPSGQTCTLGSNALGTVNNADVTVNATCGATTTYQISVAVTGLTGTLVVQDDQSENLTFTTNSTQTFPHQYPGGTNYTVTVTSQPSGQTCTLSSNANGTINANTTVAATCATATNSGEWTWINGDNIVAVGGLYPPSSPAYPGTRYGAATWLDASGNFWIWGGWGYDINGPKASCNTNNCGSNESSLSDLWEYKSGTWSYKGGQALTGQCFDFPSSTGQTGSPSARSDGQSWIDLSGNMFMFGGYETYNTPGNCNLADAFNDMWEYIPSANTWTWVNGSSTQKTKGTYPGSVGGTGTPGARYYSTGARDSNGNFWMLGGYAYDSGGTQGYMNDLWEWNGTTWTWVSGSKTHDPKGTYTGGSPVPGGRAGANSWFDSSGNFWVFGGLGWDSASNIGQLNDLWSFNPSTSKWTFVGGSTTANAPGSYGTQGVADPSNLPPGRFWATNWLTPSGDVYILGGQQFGGGIYNDLWKYSGGNWTWIAPDMPTDSNPFINELGIYGTQGTANSANAPGSREQGMGWTDAGGNLWLFGGFGWGTLPVSSSGNVHSGEDSLQDLWEFQP